ncbi:MAG: peroxide stress protein YaaA [Gammaproteobacteria bacterium]|nr:peroxide stress protein YaaA [Gammaproteobacteria bacterium]
MLTLISPAKKIDTDYPLPPVLAAAEATQPTLLTHSQQLITTLCNYTDEGLMKLMAISRSLAELNSGRYRNWSPPFSQPSERQALFIFKGDLYTGIDVDSCSGEDLCFAQNHLAILSGLYGLLRPLDLIHPYRLEMGTRLPTDRGSNLYQFWGDIITDEINRLLAQDEGGVVINLASNEYFKAVKTARIQGRIVTPVFKERKGEGYKIVGVHAKRARGEMSRYIIDNRIGDVEQLTAFNSLGYRYSPERSNADEWIFIRG